MPAKKDRAKKKSKPGEITPVIYDYETFVDQQVTITAKGFEKEQKGKKKISIKKIISIEKAE